VPLLTITLAFWKARPPLLHLAVQACAGRGSWLDPTSVDALRIFEGWSLHDPVGLYDNGGGVAIDRHFEHAPERFGYERSASSRILNEIGQNAIMDKNASD
jgi:hypothetical protein